MKKLIIIFSSVLIIITGCRKEKINEENNPPLNTTPKAFAGNDMQFSLPLDSCELNGSAIDAENNIESYLWKKISGPVSYRLQNAGAAVTRLYQLHQGNYQFELTVTDSGKLVSRDTVMILVTEPFNSAPSVFAGNDIAITLPVDTCLLSGSAQDAENNIQSYLWRKISGPLSYQFQNANSAITKLNGLVRGMYDLELTVTDNKGLFGKDTVSVYVYDADTTSGQNERIFKDMEWSCPWGCSIEIHNLYSFIPAGTMFKVYIKKQNTNFWIEVRHVSQWTTSEKFIWGIDNNNLWIYTDDDIYGNKWDVRINY